MKKIYILIVTVLVLGITQSCTVSKGLISGEKAGIDQATLERAIQSKQFIVRFDMMYTYGGPVYLRPRSNYIIVDGDNAVISAAYLGRQYSFRPIAGINIRGRASDYEITKKVKRDRFDISMKVENAGAEFDVFLNIGSDGSVSASMNSIRISNVRYTGHLVPITRNNQQFGEGESI